METDEIGIKEKVKDAFGGGAPSVSFFVKKVVTQRCVFGLLK